MDGEVLRDDQWEKLRAFVPGGRKGKRGPRSDGRRFFDALLRRDNQRESAASIRMRMPVA